MARLTSVDLNSFYSKKLSDSVPKGVFVKGDKQEKSQACVRFLGFFYASLVLLFYLFLFNSFTCVSPHFINETIILLSIY